MSSPTSGAARAEVPTTPFGPQDNAFDATALAAIGPHAVAIREHAFVIDGRPVLAVFVLHRSPQHPSTAPDIEIVAPEFATTDLAGEPTSAPRWTADQRQLFDRLKHWRRDRAQAQGVPPYVIFNNREPAMPQDARVGCQQETGDPTGAPLASRAGW